MLAPRLASLLLATSWGAACSDEVVAPVDDGSGGSGGSGGAGSIVVASTTTVGVAGTGGAPATVATSSTATSTAAGVSSGSAECVPRGTFSDPELDVCAEARCCAELDVCLAGPTSCFVGATDEIDTSVPVGAALHECIYLAGCLGAPICDSGLSFDGIDSYTLAFAACLTELCCEDFTACTSSGEAVASCFECLQSGAPYAGVCEAAVLCSQQHCENWISTPYICDSGLVAHLDQDEGCLEAHCCEAFDACSNSSQSQEAIDACDACLDAGGGPLCDAAIACELEHCDASATEICDSGLSYADLEVAACLSENCCEEHTACTGDGSEDDVNACIDCFAEEGGPLCDAAIACTNQLCDDLGAGGAGAGGADGAGGGN